MKLQDEKQAQQKQRTRQKTRFEIIPTQPQGGKENAHGDANKASENKQYLQVPEPKKNQKEKTKRNKEQEPTGKKDT